MKFISSLFAVLSLSLGVKCSSPSSYSVKCLPPNVWQNTPEGVKCLPCPLGTTYHLNPITGQGECVPIEPITCEIGYKPYYNPDLNKWECIKVPNPCQIGEKPIWDPIRFEYNCEIVPNPCRIDQNSIWDFINFKWICEDKPKPQCKSKDWSYLIGGKYDANTGVITLQPSGEQVSVNSLYKPNRVVSSLTPDEDYNRLTIIIRQEYDCVKVVKALCI